MHKWETANAELRDWVASLGEQLASRMVAAALQEAGLEAVPADSTKLILTDDQFTNAQPRCWETYARIRWFMPSLAPNQIVVLGGFIGATEDGRTTTLGRGGSDLTASIVGAALNAEEIQVWKDVEGMLTWDPNIRSGGHRVKRLSYEEATELAQAGATILHPETIRPAQRLRIPVTIKNTFHPQGEGTRIGTAKGGCLNPVKSIACKSNITVVELRSPRPAGTLMQESAALLDRISRGGNGATLLAMSEEVIYLELGVPTPELDVAPGPCLEARVQTDQAIITLVGHSLTLGEVALSLSSFLAQRSAVLLPQKPGSCCVRLMVAQNELDRWTEILERTFFRHVDSLFFAPPVIAEQDMHSRRRSRAHWEEEAPVVQESRFPVPAVPKWSAEPQW
jgi:aspartate kinase